MSLSDKELWGIVHGMGLGAVFLLAFAGGFAILLNMRPALVTTAGLVTRVKQLKIGTSVMAVVAWATVIIGTFVVYVPYRAAAPKGADLTKYPKALLISNPDTAGWHNFGMEWKEHIAWFSPILATAVAVIVLMYGDKLAKNKTLRYATMTLFVLAFATAAIAGLYGALITKAAPVK